MESRRLQGLPKHREFIKFKKSGVFQELLTQIEGNVDVLSAPLPLNHLFPQILPGHRLWCYGMKKTGTFPAN